MVAREHVSADALVRMAHVRAAVGVVDCGGHVEGARRRHGRHGRHAHGRRRGAVGRLHRRRGGRGRGRGRGRLRRGGGHGGDGDGGGGVARRGSRKFVIREPEGEEATRLGRRARDLDQAICRMQARGRQRTDAQNTKRVMVEEQRARTGESTAVTVKAPALWRKRAHICAPACTRICGADRGRDTTHTHRCVLSAHPLCLAACRNAAPLAFSLVVHRRCRIRALCIVRCTPIHSLAQCTYAETLAHSLTRSRLSRTATDVGFGTQNKK
eukprot:6212798-Pleurochrysis_carterae.AAC.5